MVWVGFSVVVMLKQGQAIILCGYVCVLVITMCRVLVQAFKALRIKDLGKCFPEAGRELCSYFSEQMDTTETVWKKNINVHCRKGNLGLKLKSSPCCFMSSVCHQSSLMNSFCYLESVFFTFRYTNTGKYPHANCGGSENCSPACTSSCHSPSRAVRF